MAEIALYGDVVLRLVNTDAFTGHFWPNFEDLTTATHENETQSGPRAETAPVKSGFSVGTGKEEKNEKGFSFGFERFDHIVGNLWSLEPTLSTLKALTGFHEFAEFAAEDVGTVDSGLNSIVLASPNERVLLPLNEPIFGTKRKSQIQSYLETNGGEGVQHMALFTGDIFNTVRAMRAVSDSAGMGGAGFEFLPAQRDAYYETLPARLGDSLSTSQYADLKALGILADKDSEGVLLQIFTKPVGDRSTLFLEVIQRIGCGPRGQERPGCGGFGKGNFKELFRSIEDFERALEAK